LFPNRLSTANAIVGSLFWKEERYAGIELCAVGAEAADAWAVNPLPDADSPLYDLGSDHEHLIGLEEQKCSRLFILKIQCYLGL
jgi:hypothetical protein